ncbi:hypothetical protein RF11_09261 [Thelohanellus kitauei]|uniref:Uncharacterized protein n=1 Tax=Thelohanellus kitauei TaxID=669202 RepID=A0A0C2MT22_THEKT|nr:hypothetical protein RF11_09261 [Thelohanellus kitauei]
MMTNLKPRCVHFAIIAKMLLSVCVMGWDSAKNCKVTPNLISQTEFTIKLLVNAGWLPPEFTVFIEMLSLVMPKYIYYFLSHLWKIYYDQLSPLDECDFKASKFAKCINYSLFQLILKHSILF